MNDRKRRMGVALRNKDRRIQQVACSGSALFLRQVSGPVPAHTRPSFGNCHAGPAPDGTAIPFRCGRRSISGSAAHTGVATYGRRADSWRARGKPKDQNEMNDREQEQAIRERNVNEQPGF